MIKRVLLTFFVSTLIFSSGVFLSPTFAEFSASNQNEKIGCGVRRKAVFVRIYEICLWSKRQPQKSWRLAFNENPAFTFDLYLDILYSAGGEKMAAAFKESLDKQNLAQKEGTKEEVDKFLKWTQGLGVNKGSSLKLYFNDKNTQKRVRVAYKGPAGEKDFKSNDSQFAQALAGIWLDEEHAISSKIRKKLLGL